MIYIITRTHDQADYMARYDLKLDSRYAWTWVRDSQNLRGIDGNNNSIVLGVGFWERPDALEIIELIKHRNLPMYCWTEGETE